MPNARWSYGRCDPAKELQRFAVNQILADRGGHEMRELAMQKTLQTPEESRLCNQYQALKRTLHSPTLETSCNLSRKHLGAVLSIRDRAPHCMAPLSDRIECPARSIGTYVSIVQPSFRVTEALHRDELRRFYVEFVDLSHNSIGNHYPFSSHEIPLLG